MNFSYARLSSDSVIELMETHYAFNKPIQCTFFTLGLHDSYLVEMEGQKYIFRIYCNNWRNNEQILFELELLSYFKKRSANVATAVATTQSTQHIALKFPEGERLAALFEYAEGRAPGQNISVQECRLLGNSVAKLHHVSDKFETRYLREHLDLPFLVERSLVLINPFLEAPQVQYLQKIEGILYEKLSNLNTNNANYGVCIGDINSTNFHINENNAITHFDLDQCGFAFRAFEIGKFSSSLLSHKNKSSLMLAFLQGYQSERTLSDEEKYSIAYFEIASLIWVMSIHVSNIQKIGYQYLDQLFWNARVEKIRLLENNLK